VTPLRLVAEAAAILRATLNVPCAYIAVTANRTAVVLRVPVSPAMNMVCTFEEDDDGTNHVRVYTPLPDMDHTFKYSKTNLVGCLGKPEADALFLHNVTAGIPPENWLVHQTLGRPSLLWDKSYSAESFLSEPIGPRSMRNDANPACPYKRLKVYLDGRTAIWKFATLQEDGLSLSTMSGGFNNKDMCIAHAEEYARQRDLHPIATSVANRGLRVNHYFISYTLDGDANVQMDLSNGKVLVATHEDLYTALKTTNAQFKTMHVAKSPGPTVPLGKVKDLTDNPDYGFKRRFPCT